VHRQQKELEAINLKIEELNEDLEQKVVLRTSQLEQAMKALEDIERVKEKLIKKYKSIEVFVSKKGAFRQIIKIQKD